MHPHRIQARFPIRLDFAISEAESYVFFENRKAFLAQLMTDREDGKLCVTVRYCGPSSNAKNLFYRVSFVGNNMEYCCSEHPIQVGKIGAITTETTTRVDTLEIDKILDRPISAVCKIVTFIKEAAIKEPGEYKDKELNQGNDLLRKLECPVCLEYMIPPIMQCHQGHSFCQPCCKKITTCPICRSAISGARNFILEDITSNFQYPCKYRRYGCQFSATANNIQQHEATCINGPYKCIILNCIWEDIYAKFLEHLSKAHKDNILVTDSVRYRLNNTLDREYCDYICIVNDQAFRIEFQRNSDKFLWLVHTNNDEDAEKYMLNLEFETENNKRPYIHTIAPIVEMRVFYQVQLNKFINGDVLTYKMNIVERK